MINVEALLEVANKFALINKYIDEGKEIPHELSKNFIYFPLSEDPFGDLLNDDEF